MSLNSEQSRAFPSGAKDEVHDGHDPWIETTLDHVTLILGGSKNIELERLAARAVAVMWNTLDESVVAPFLDENVVYESQILGERAFKGKACFLEHFRNKFVWLRKDETVKVFAEMGEYQCHPCVVLALNSRQNRLAVLMLDVSNEFVSRINWCFVMPCPEEVSPTSVYPETL